MANVIWVVWCCCSDPQTRWQRLGEWNEDKAKKEMDVGNERAVRFETQIRYLALPTGKNPNALTGVVDANPS